MACVAAIDIGTNTVRLLIQTAAGKQLAREVAITRLGQGVDVASALAPEAIARTLQAIDRYGELIQEHEPERLRIIATSACRDAKNREEFFQGVKQRLGQIPELLSGDSEARLSFEGATLGLKQDQDPRVVVDIGGGSTELAFGHTSVDHAISLDVGAVRITERHLHGDPPSAQQIDAALADLQRELSKAERFRALPAATQWIGVAGSVTTIAAHVAGLKTYHPTVTHRMLLSRDDVASSFDHFRRLTIAERRPLLIEPKRAETIVGSAAVLHALFTVFDLDSITVSQTDILDGIAASVLR